MARECRYQAAIVDRDRVLLIQHRDRLSDRRYWVPPGGGLEPGESEEDCVRREVHEETHLDVEVRGLLLVVAHAEGEVYRQSKTYLCRVVGGEPRPGFEPEHGPEATYDITDVAWVPLADDAAWREEVRTDPHTTGFLRAVREALGYS